MPQPPSLRNNPNSILGSVSNKNDKEFSLTFAAVATLT